MKKLSYARFLAKISILLTATGIIHLPLSEEARLGLYQSTFERGTDIWNQLASHWNSGERDRLLRAAHNNIYFHSIKKSFPTESALIMDAAGSPETLPLIKRMDDSTLLLQDANTGETILEITDLDKIRELNEASLDNW